MDTQFAQSAEPQKPASAVGKTSASQKPRHIYIDCTSTYMTGLNTGIQRVVRGLVEREEALSRHAGVPCIPVIAFRGRFWPFSRTQRAWMLSILTEGAQSRKTARGRFMRLQGAILAVGDRLHVPRGVTEAPLGVIRGILARLLWRLKALTPLRVFRRHEVQAIEPAPRDLLLIPDAFWGGHGQLPAIKRFAAAGGAVVPVVHDVAPWTHPVYFPDFDARLFTQGLTSILAVACGVLTVSRAVMTDVGRFCAEQGYGHIPLDYTYSGADITQPIQASMVPVRPAIVAHYQARPFLMVGTLEPRKGYRAALDAYALYRQAGGCRPLVIVGRRGWKELDILARMETVVAASGSVFFYDDASDTELGALYQYAGALIFASHYEGFGLPLVEAMHMGVPVIASDIPVFREIGEDYPAYFRVADAEDLCRALQEHDQAMGGGRKPPRLWPTWDGAAPKYIDKAIALYAKGRMNSTS